MKEQRNYSLTAKERKALRNSAAQKTEEKTKPETQVESDLVRQEGEMLAAQKKSRKTTLLIGAVVCVAILLILVGMLVPVIAFLINPYRNYKDVIARFDLSNGMKLEFVIDENLYDTAATNFIFLAKNGYFDNTVFFDAQNGWIRFGGYEGYPTTNSSSDYKNTKHHSHNRTYCDNFKAIDSGLLRDDNSLYKFDYKLRADKTGENVSLLNDIGVLAFLYSDTSTEFEMSYQHQAINDVPNVGSGTTVLEPTMVGHALDGPDGATVNNLIEISRLASTASNVTTGPKWLPPKDIYINTVKVYNLADSKWKNFDFVSYLQGNDESGSRRYSSWHLKTP